MDLELSERFAGIRQGMKVVDSAGNVVGKVRDTSRRSLLVMEAGSTRVYWLDGDEVAAIESQVVRLKHQAAAWPTMGSTSPA